MPKELKQRGRRADKKRKADADADTNSQKRPKLDADDHAENDILVSGDAGDDFIGIEQSFENEEPATAQQQFYGLLDEEESEYYLNVNSKISADNFDSDEDRILFIEAVYRESKGKEIKIASSQSASRCLENIIQLSTKQQLISLFKAFLQDLTYLVQHRFGSHCCEALFSKAAQYVDGDENRLNDEDNVDALYLQAVKVLEPNAGYLLTERFASHSIRVLMLVLSNESLDDISLLRIAMSRKKEKQDLGRGDDTESQPKRKVSKSFITALSSLIKGAIGSLDKTYLQALATHPTGNPVLQLLLRLEFTINGGPGPLSSRLSIDRDFEAESEGGRFMSGLVYDPTGSHLVEALVKHMPGKLFKKWYPKLFQERIGKLAKNDIAGYVVIRILERISQADLSEAKEKILKEIPGMIERKRFAVIRTLIERCEIRKVSVVDIAQAITSAFGRNTENLLPELLQINDETTDTEAQKGFTDHSTKQSKSRTNVHGSLLAQTMLNTAVMNQLIIDSIITQPSASLVTWSKDPIASRTLQVALISPLVSDKARRILIPHFKGHMAELATNFAGSHVADALWKSSVPLFMKEPLAEELKENEQQLRDSEYGRSVWRNWHMDFRQSRPEEWRQIAKRGASKPPQTNSIQSADKRGVGKTSGEIASERHVTEKKTSTDTARERHAQKRGFPITRDTHDPEKKTPIELARERHARKMGLQPKQTPIELARARHAQRGSQTSRGPNEGEATPVTNESNHNAPAPLQV